ncbi:MAG: aminotransferase class V-fold PLP-dependent enzyme [Myxococcales bacterium]|nr:aminotransferase class V-fold PLP-dependent enzyme [Myxococcales bacterium]
MSEGVSRPLLMVPGPVEISPEVSAAHSGSPIGHLSDDLVAAHGRALEQMRQIWQAPADAQPFIVAGSGTLAMEMAAANLVEPGAKALVVNTGYFSERMMEILRRYGARVSSVDAEPGYAVPLSAIEIALHRNKPDSVFVTHVDTSTGVRMPAQAVGELAHRYGALTVVDGVCATGAEPLSMDSGSVDVYVSSSQKALGLPPGLALLVVNDKALDARDKLSSLPPYYLDYLAWRPVMQAYEAREKMYFATPATNLVRATPIAFNEMLCDVFGETQGIEARWRRHAHVAKALNQAWRALRLQHVCERSEDRGVTLSALRYSSKIGPELVSAICRQGVIVAGGLHPKIKNTYFRVGHMGWSITQVDFLVRTVRAIANGLRECGEAVSPDEAVAELEAGLKN